MIVFIKQPFLIYSTYGCSRPSGARSGNFGFEMLREDVVSISQSLLIPVSALQKMPLDQVCCMSDMIRQAPQTFLVAAKNVPIEILIGKNLHLP